MIIIKKILELPKLQPNDYLTKGTEFWKNYREILTKILFSEQEILERTPENIVYLANKSGVKVCARYFNITPSLVRYYRKKLSEKNE